MKRESRELSLRAASLLLQGQLPAAEAAALLAITHDKTNVSGWHVLGECYAKDKEYARAIPCYLQLLALAPARIDAWSDLGDLYLRTMDYQKAAAALRQAIALDPASRHPHGVRARSLVAKTVGTLRKS